MRYSLSNRQSEFYLEKADEIYIYYRDFAVFDEIIEKYPQKDFLIILDEDDSVAISDWDFIAICAQRVNLEVECTILEQFQECRNRKIPFCLHRQIDSFYELNIWKEFGATSFYIGPSLFFDMKNLLQKGLKIRFIPNVPNNNSMRQSNKNWINAPWIRPEDIELYSGENNICRFNLNAGDYLKQEGALYRIYTDHEWLGSLDMIIHNVGTTCRSVALPQNFGSTRLECRHKCQINPNSCHFCHTCEKLGKTLENQITGTPS